MRLVKELLDETLPNPASLFETVQSTTNTYIGMAMSVPKPYAEKVKNSVPTDFGTKPLLATDDESEAADTDIKSMLYPQALEEAKKAQSSSSGNLSSDVSDK